MQVKIVFSLKLTKVKKFSNMFCGQVLEKQALSYTVGEVVNIFRAITQYLSKFFLIFIPLNPTISFL